MKKFFSALIFIILIGGGGYFFYTQVQQTKAPDKVATDTGTVVIQKEELAKEAEEAKKIAKKVKEKRKNVKEYKETFPSWEEFNNKENDDTSYTTEEHPDKKLYLVVASENEDGSISATFNDEPVNKPK